MKMTDKQLIISIKKDDYASYNHLFVTYYTKLCMYVNEIINNASDTEDIVQELFVKLWANRKKLEIQSSLSGYLFKTAKNMALNYIRNENNRKVIIDKLELQWEFTTEKTLEDTEFINALKKCIEELPERCKNVLVLQHLDGYKQKEIADKLNITVKTVKNQMWIGMQRLKICLGSKGV